MKWQTVNRSLLSVTILCFALPAHAEDIPSLAISQPHSVEVQAQTHVLFSAEQDTFEPNQPLQNSLLHESNVRAQYANYGLGIRFANSLLPNDAGKFEQPFVLEKKSLNARWGDVQLVLGDSHQELGKGIALALYEDTAFGINNTLEGVSATYRPQNGKFHLFGGRVNALKLPVAVNPQENVVRDRTLWLAGAELKGKVTSDITLGGHYLLALNQPLGSTDFDQRWHTVGASFQRLGIMDGVEAYLETNLLMPQRLGANPENQDFAYGSYASFTWIPTPWQLKLEGKDYRNYRFDFRRPPTLEEDIVETLNTQDVSATRLSAERRFFGTQTKLKASYLIGDDRTKESILHHGVVKAQFAGPWDSKMELGGGYRWMPQLEDLAHVSLKTQWKTFKAQSLEFTLLKQIKRTNLDVLPTREDRNKLNVTYNFSSQFNVSSGFEYIPTNAIDQGKSFASVGAALTLGAFASKAFLGKTSGGTQCSGGVCRQVPAYTGALVESTYTF